MVIERSVGVDLAFKYYSSTIEYIRRANQFILDNDCTDGIQEESIEEFLEAIHEKSISSNVKEETLLKVSLLNEPSKENIPLMMDLVPSMKIEKSKCCSRSYYHSRLGDVSFSKGIVSFSRVMTPHYVYLLSDWGKSISKNDIAKLVLYKEPFPFYVVSKNDKVISRLSPFELSAMRRPLANAKGKIITYGIGTGYFICMAAKSDKVKSITVVEQDDRISHIFTNGILPKFDGAEKIKIIHGTPLKPVIGDFDFCYINSFMVVDLNTFKQYLRIKDIHSTLGQCKTYISLENIFILERLVSSFMDYIEYGSEFTNLIHNLINDIVISDPKDVDRLFTIRFWKNLLETKHGYSDLIR